MELMKQQALNFGTRVVGEDVVEVDLQRPAAEGDDQRRGNRRDSHLIVATGARANYLGLPSEESFKNRGVSALRGVRRRLAPLPQQAAGGRRRRAIPPSKRRPT